MEGEGDEEKLIQSVNGEKSVPEQTDDVESSINDIINVINEDEIHLPNESAQENGEEANWNEDVSISEFPNLNVNSENIPIGPTLINTFDMSDILNMQDASCKSDVVFDDTNPKTFIKLPPGIIDLNVAPENWLYPSVNLPNPIKIQSNYKESNSFWIASMFPDYNAKTQIVADADVVKTIFKIPYNKKYVSLIVRKIGNVFLIDNFNIKNAIGTNENNSTQLDENFAKLRKLDNHSRNVNNSNKKLRQRNMFSKFLFRSIADDAFVGLSGASQHLAPTESVCSEDVYPVHKFSRVIYWTFEEIQMLIGTNILNQYFIENEASRNVSLHLAEVGKPLKTSNAIDIWVDNLICNIPEAVICFQSDGIVNCYENVQTHNIPYLQGSQFSITKMKASVQKFFSFLSNQKFQNGESYWLLRCRNDNVTQFFNLNMLERATREVKMTSFAYECGILSYIFAHKQHYSYANRKKLNPRMLLNFTVTTLNKQVHPEIIASANHLIVNSIISYEIFKQPLFTLSKAVFRNSKKESKSVRNNCLEALDKIIDGLKCLENFYGSENSYKNKSEQNTKSNPPWKFNLNSKKTKKQAPDEVFYINISFLFPKKEYRIVEILPTWQTTNNDRNYWKTYLKLHFYRKAELAYGVLAQHYFYHDLYGLCLRSLSTMIRCNKVKTKIEPSYHLIPIQLVFIMAGDCYQLTADLSRELKEALSNDCKNMEEIENILKSDEQYYKLKSSANYNLQMDLNDLSKRKLLEKCIAFYEKSLRYEGMDFIAKKMFPVYLELGFIYCDMLNKSRKEIDDSTAMRYFEQSRDYFNKALDYADSPLDKASALFHYSQLHSVLFKFDIDKMTTSSEGKNLSMYFKIFLESIRKLLQILYDGDKEECKLQFEIYFSQFNNSFCKLVRFLPHTCEINKMKNKAVCNILSEFDCTVTPLKEITNLSEAKRKQYQDFHSYFECALWAWNIGSAFGNVMRVGCMTNYSNIIRDHFLQSTDCYTWLLTTNEFSIDMWGVYMRIIFDSSDFYFWCQSTDQFKLPCNEQMESIRAFLKLYYHGSVKLKELINNDFDDERVTSDQFKDQLPRLYLNFQKLLFDGLELLLADTSIEKKEIMETQQFSALSFIFQHVAATPNEYRSYLKIATDAIVRMGENMQFSKLR